LISPLFMLPQPSKQHEIHSLLISVIDSKQRAGGQVN